MHGVQVYIQVMKFCSENAGKVLKCLNFRFYNWVLSLM